ncbi:MAG TPA: hypothetical protein VFN67_29900 [Polyangiales bacterium]|nr:hypothetical protein [Polyangiales bacterium]
MARRRFTIDSSQRWIDAVAELKRARRSGCSDPVELRMLQSRVASAASALVPAKRNEQGISIEGLTTSAGTLP